MELKRKELFQASDLLTDNSLQYELSPPSSHYLVQPMPNISDDNSRRVSLDKTLENITKDDFKNANPPTSSLIPEEAISDKVQELKPSDFLFFAANSTFHGMSHIFTPGKISFRKLLWALAFAISLALFLVQANDRYAFYETHPHVTKLDEKEVAEMKFPAVTVCNTNSFRLNEITTDDYFFAGEHILELFDSDYSLKSSNHKETPTWSLVMTRIKSILQQRGDFMPSNSEFNVSEFYNRTGHDVKNIVKQCKYRGEDCSPGDFWTTVFTRYGKCYTFNSGKVGKLLRTLKGGIDNGLEVLLDAEQDNYMPVWAESDEISVEAGFKVQIHAQDEPPFIHELGFGISPGFQTLVATQEQRITFLPEPYGTCESGSNKELHSYYVNYSISACRITCETNFVVGKCGCRMVHMPGSAPFCSPEQYKQCADEKLDMLVQSDEKLCVCKTPCEVTRYNLEMSSLRLPSTQALSYLAYKYNKTEDYVRKNFVKLNIFFEALNYETIDQKKAYELPGLLGDIGGQMGLFIGASILTVLEIFDYIYEVFKEKVWRRRLKKRWFKKNSENQTEMKVFKGPMQQTLPECSPQQAENCVIYNEYPGFSEYNHVRNPPSRLRGNAVNQNPLFSQHFGNSMTAISGNGVEKWSKPSCQFVDVPRLGKEKMTASSHDLHIAVSNPSFTEDFKKPFPTPEADRTPKEVAPVLTPAAEMFHRPLFGGRELQVRNQPPTPIPSLAFQQHYVSKETDIH